MALVLPGVLIIYQGHLFPLKGHLPHLSQCAAQELGENAMKAWPTERSRGHGHWFFGTFTHLLKGK